MKRFISIITIIAVLMCLSASFSAETVFRFGDWTLSVSDGTDDFAFGIRSYDAEDAVVTVPNDYGGYPIIAVGAYAFATNTTVREVILSDQIAMIGDGAFTQCANLSKIAIPDSVTAIGDNAFQGCDQLVIYAAADSYAIAYAEEHDISYVFVKKTTYLLGDSDNDGEVLLFDASVIQRYLSGMKVSNHDIIERNCDMNGDGLDITDATWIQRYIAETEIPYEVGRVITLYIQ